MARTHELKTWPEFFQALSDGRKTFEVRENDRGYEEGDILWLREYDPAQEAYTGRSTEMDVSYVMAGGQFGLAENVCVLGLVHDMRLCESEMLVLRPDYVYRFTVAPDCRRCNEIAAVRDYQPEPAP